jgi:hypothetical protein
MGILMGFARTIRKMGCKIEDCICNDDKDDDDEETLYEVYLNS